MICRNLRMIKMVVIKIVLGRQIQIAVKNENC